MANIQRNEFIEEIWVKMGQGGTAARKRPEERQGRREGTGGWPRRQVRLCCLCPTKGKGGALSNVNLLSLLCLEIKQFNVNSERYYILHG